MGAVKIIIFATYWQGLFVSFVPIDAELAELWNDFILCCEMTVFAVVHLYSFPWWEFRTGMPSSSELVAQNAKKVLSFKDVMSDVYHNIAPAYQTYVLQTDDGVKEYKTKTYMIGNLHHNSSSSRDGGKQHKNGKKTKKYKQGKYMLHTDDINDDDSRFDDSRFDVTETENENDYEYDYNDDDEEDDGNMSNALGGGNKMRRHINKRKKTPDSLTNLIGNDSSEKLDMSPIEIHNAENDDGDESDPQIT